ncbi:MAG: hypothetical protein OCC49_11885 [Fibrobacterales bacterium]
MAKSFFICAGDHSGVLIGARVMDQLTARYPGCTFKGVGGDAMIERGLNTLVPFSKVAVSGFVEVFARISFFKKLIRQAKNEIASERYCCVILIDYAGLNMKLLKQCKQSMVPVYYIAPPQVWAWKKGRVTAFKNIMVQTVLPFEAQFYQEAGAEVYYAGHPVYDRLPGAYTSRDSIIIVPGSRKGVVVSNALSFKMVAEQLRRGLSEDIAIEVVLPRFLAKDPEIQDLFFEYRMTTKFYDALGRARFAVAVPGTNNVELAAYGVPSVILYKAGFINYAIARLFVSIPYMSAVNILLNRALFPELLFWRESSLKKFVSFAITNVLSREEQVIRDLMTISDQLTPRDGEGFAAVAARNIGELIDG